MPDDKPPFPGPESPTEAIPKPPPPPEPPAPEPPPPCYPLSAYNPPPPPELPPIPEPPLPPAPPRLPPPPPDPLPPCVPEQPEVKTGHPAARMLDPLKHGGFIQEGSTDTFIEKRGAARFTDATTCPIKGTGMLMGTSKTVFINNRGAARKNDQADCGTTGTWASFDILGLHIDVGQHERSLTDGESFRLLHITDDNLGPLNDITVGLLRGVRDPAGFGSLTAAILAVNPGWDSEASLLGLSLNIDMLAGGDGQRIGVSLVLNASAYGANFTSPTFSADPMFGDEARLNFGGGVGPGFGGGLGAFYDRVDGRIHVTGQTGNVMFDWTWDVGEPEGAAADPAVEMIMAGAGTVFIGP